MSNIGYFLKAVSSCGSVKETPKKGNQSQWVKEPEVRDKWCRIGTKALGKIPERSEQKSERALITTERPL